MVPSMSKNSADAPTTTPAVTRTPIVASASAGAATVRRSRPAGAEPAFVQDDHEGRDGDALGQVGVGEADPVQPVIADRHPGDQEQDEAGDPDPLGDARADHAGDEERRPGEHQVVGGDLVVHRLGQPPSADEPTSAGTACPDADRHARGHGGCKRAAVCPVAPPSALTGTRGRRWSSAAAVGVSRRGAAGRAASVRRGRACRSPRRWLAPPRRVPWPRRPGRSAPARRPTRGGSRPGPVERPAARTARRGREVPIGEIELARREGGTGQAHVVGVGPRR